METLFQPRDAKVTFFSEQKGIQEVSTQQKLQLPYLSCYSTVLYPYLLHAYK